MIFKDRRDAGLQLAEVLSYLAGRADVQLLTLARGGVPVGQVVAKNLQLPFSVILVRKIGAPANQEYAVGAIAEGDVTLIDSNQVERLRIDQTALQQIIDQEKQELARRLKLYRDNQPLPDLTQKTAVVVDDGVATGTTARAAAQFIRHQLHPKKIILATPVISTEVKAELIDDFDEIVAVAELSHLRAIGQAYQEFEQVTDEEVMKLIS